MSGLAWWLDRWDQWAFRLDDEAGARGLGRLFWMELAAEEDEAFLGTKGGLLQGMRKKGGRHLEACRGTKTAMDQACWGKNERGSRME